VTSIFNRQARQTRLAEFEVKYALIEREGLAVRLAAYQLGRRYGPTMAYRAATLKWRPKEVETRAQLYQMNAEYETFLHAFRAKLGLPPRERPSRMPS